LAAVENAIKEAFHGFDNQDALSIDAGFADIGRMYDALAEGVILYAERIAEGPIDASVPDHYRALGASTHHLADGARAGTVILHQAHDVEMQRLENPRPLEAETFDQRLQEQ
jgi:hypothetical protein